MDIAHRSNFVNSFGSGFVVTGLGWIYKSPAYYAQQLYSRGAETYPLRVETSSTLAWQLWEPDLSAVLSPDGKTLRIYAVNSTLDAIRTTIQLEDFQSPVSGGTVYTLEDREHALTAEVMNSRDNPERISFRTQPAGVSGKEFDSTFPPLSLTLLELTMGK